ncbi:MAG: orotidine-5'-phosphate decarboxylase [Myxococcota bacterium]
MTSDTPRHFADTLIESVRALGHPLCLGLDPYLERIPPLFARGSMQPGDPESADAAEAFCLAVIERAAGRVAIVKPQIACFEPLGWRGVRALERVVARAREAGLLVLLDAKRGDIGMSAEGYARAYLAPGAALAADAMTVNPYLGLETLEPFAAQARMHGRGLFALVKTSNPGSGDLQDLEIAGAGQPVYGAVAKFLAPLADELVGPATGWSSLGVVVGATYPEPAERVREALPRALFLVPGYGSQGASAADAVRGFVAGPAGREGGVVNASRSILYPDAGATENAGRWEAAFDEGLGAAIDELGAAVSRG